MPISTRNTSELPDVKKLRLAFQSMAMLDAILMPEWEFRYYSFGFDDAPGSNISRGSMRNGSGDDLDAIFGTAGCLIRGFAHEHPMSPYATNPPRVFPGVLDNLPAEFDACRAACDEDWWRAITFCLWRSYDDPKWQTGQIDFPNHQDPDGSEVLLSPLDGRPETYHAWAKEYYSLENLDLGAVIHVFQHLPLNERILGKLNPALSLIDLTEETRSIGYPASEG